VIDVDFFPFSGESSLSPTLIWRNRLLQSGSVQIRGKERPMAKQGKSRRRIWAKQQKQIQALSFIIISDRGTYRAMV
jgi:hypothetical protein